MGEQETMKQYQKKEYMNVVTTYGRCFYSEQDDVLYFNWTNCSIEVKFTGKILIGTFRFVPDNRIITKMGRVPMQNITVSVPDYPCLAVFVDGQEEPYKKIQPTKEEDSIVLFKAEKEETHVIRVVKLTENMRTMVGLCSLDCDGILEKPEPIKKKTIEFIGDSITCGFGNEANSMNDPFLTAEENGYLSYGPIAARALGMEYQMMCISGITLAKYEEFPMPYAIENLYEYTDLVTQDRLRGIIPMDPKSWENAKPCDYEKWDFKSHHMDYVAINLGTNDATVTRFGDHKQVEKKFVDRYVDFLKKVRTLNGPDTHIICSLGPMCYYLYPEILEAVDRYREETGDTNISTLRYTKMLLGGPDAGACAHPSVEMDRHMAAELVAHIRNLENQ